MEFEWDETKRRTNIRDHKVDFVDAAQLFDGRPTFTYQIQSGDPDVDVGQPVLAGDGDGSCPARGRP